MSLDPLVKEMIYVAISATNGSAENTDYDSGAFPKTVTFTAGQGTGATQTVSFDPASDTLVEGDETVTLAIWTGPSFYPARAALRARICSRTCRPAPSTWRATSSAALSASPAFTCAMSSRCSRMIAARRASVKLKRRLTARSTSRCFHQSSAAFRL